MYILDKYTKYIFSPCLPTPHPPKWKPMLPSWVRTPEYLEIEIGAFRTPEYSVYLRWHTLIDGNSLQPIENENNRQWTTLRPTNERLSHTTMHKTIIHCTTSVVTSYASCLVRNQLSLNQPLWRHDPRRGWSDRYLCWIPIGLFDVYLRSSVYSCATVVSTLMERSNHFMFHY